MNFGDENLEFRMHFVFAVPWAVGVFFSIVLRNEFWRLMVFDGCNCVVDI